MVNLSIRGSWVKPKQRPNFHINNKCPCHYLQPGAPGEKVLLHFLCCFTHSHVSEPWAQDQGLADEGTEKLLFMRSPSQTAAEGCRVGVQGGLSGSGGWRHVCCLSGDWKWTPINAGTMEASAKNRCFRNFYYFMSASCSVIPNIKMPQIPQPVGLGTRRRKQWGYYLPSKGMPKTRGTTHQSPDQEGRQWKPWTPEDNAEIPCASFATPPSPQL